MRFHDYIAVCDLFGRSLDEAVRYQVRDATGAAVDVPTSADASHRGQWDNIKDIIQTAILQYMQKRGRRLSDKLVVDTIRHTMTDYETEWRNTAKTFVLRSDRRFSSERQLERWNSIVNQAANKVGYLIDHIFPSLTAEALKAENEKWRAAKLNNLPTWAT